MDTAHIAPIGEVACTGHVETPRSAHALVCQQRANHELGIFARQYALDERTEAGPFGAKWQRDGCAAGINVLRVRVPVCNDVGEIKVVRELRLIPDSGGFFECTADVAELSQ